MKQKSFTEEDVKKLVEQIRAYLKEDPLKGWAYIKSRKITDEERAVIEAVWPTIPGWKKDSELLYKGFEAFNKRIDPYVNKIWARELKKLCKELFGE